MNPMGQALNYLGCSLDEIEYAVRSDTPLERNQWLYQARLNICAAMTALSSVEGGTK